MHSSAVGHGGCLLQQHAMLTPLCPSEMGSSSNPKRSAQDFWWPSRGVVHVHALVQDNHTFAQGSIAP